VLLEQLRDLLAVLVDRSVVVAKACEKLLAQLCVFGERVTNELPQVVGRYVVKDCLDIFAFVLWWIV
jgi:hypothetical protein